MFYILENKEARLVDIQEINKDVISVGYLTLEELSDSYVQLEINENVIKDCMADQTHFRTSIDAYDEFSFGIINIIDILHLDKATTKDRIGFIVKRNQFILIKLLDEDDSCLEMFESAIGRFKQNITIEKVIFGIFESLLANGNKYLEVTERKIMHMEKNLVNGVLKQDLTRDIFALRNELSVLKNYYEKLFSIGEELQENENTLFDDSDLRYFKIFTDKADRLTRNITELSENLIHLREALDASLNYNLNSIMKIFTVVTTIFMPLTLIVGWYGMNFQTMPELTWKYGYLMVIIISLIVIGICLYIFKKKKLF